MRRSVPLQSQTSEPLIVVEESSGQEYEEKPQEIQTPSSEEDSPLMNPYLLSPWRDARETRKHSLPTPQCSGITASQVRRLSERGDGTTGPSPRQAEFLATLSTAPAPAPGGRRHSVVTISKVPPALFGRNRRESVAGAPGRLLRRDSTTGGPPSTEPRGSVHNLQLDIMDDIVQARKVRMKVWNTSSEKVCEVQNIDDDGQVQRYTNSRRFSDFVGTALAPIPSGKRRASELPPCAASTSGASKTGIICSNTDLISILSSLTSSSTEIDQCEAPPKTSRRQSLITNRSNSFDVSDFDPSPNWFSQRHQPMASKTTQKVSFADDVKGPETVVWDERSGSLVDAEALGNAIEVFLRRGSAEPCPLTFKNEVAPAGVLKKQHHESFVQTNTTNILKPSLEPPKINVSSIDTSKIQSPLAKMQEALVLLPTPPLNPPSGVRKPPLPLNKCPAIVPPPSKLSSSSPSSSSSKGSKVSQNASLPKPAKTTKSGKPIDDLQASSPKTKAKGWFSGKNEDEASADSCDSSLCSTLKDLFVK